MDYKNFTTAQSTGTFEYLNLDSMVHEFNKLKDKYKPEEMVNRIEVRHIHEFLTLCDGVGVETIHNNYKVGCFTGIPVIKNEALQPNYYKMYNNKGDVIAEGILRTIAPSSYEMRARYDMKVTVPKNPHLDIKGV